MRLPPFVLVLPLLAAGCATHGPQPALPGSVSAPPPAMAPARDAGDPLLTTGTWLWQGTRRADGTTIVPDAPERYTLSFQPGGRVDVRADCNRGSGSYRLNGEMLTFGPIALTRAMCPPGSRDTDFLTGLAAVAGHVDTGGELVLTQAGNAGSMRFRVAGR